MPLYEYTCTDCGTWFDALAPAGSEVPSCPSCGAGRVRREISLFAAGGPGGRSSGQGCGCGGACACGH